MKKTILKIFVVVIMTILFVNTITFSNNITNTTKKVIGIVYDDSWSMVSNGEDYAYANYAVQSLISNTDLSHCDVIIDTIVQNYLSLSMQKFSSNVVENCIK